MKTVITVFVLLGLAFSLQADPASPAAPTNGIASRQPAPDSLESLLDGVVSDMVTAKDRSREFYGTPGDQEIVLVNTGHSIPWPESYGPRTIAGWRLIPQSQYTPPPTEQRRKHNRKLGLRIDLLCVNPAILDPKRGDPFFGPITVTIFNVGGDKNGAVIGGGRFFYSANLRDGKWVVEFKGAFDA